MPSLDDELLQELLNTFRAEAAEHLQTINQSLLRLERAPDEKLRSKTLQDAFRAAHSLKGAARAVSVNDIEALSHTMESVFQQARDQGQPLDPDVCDVLYDALDAIEQVLQGQSVDIEPLQVRLVSLVGDDAELPFKPVSARASVPNGNVVSPVDTPVEETIRVSVNKLDDLMAQVGELLVAKISSDQRLTDMRDVSYRFDQWLKSWREIKNIAPQLEGDAGKRIYDVMERQTTHTDALLESLRHLDQSINRDMMRLGMVTNGLQDGVRKVRMVPFQSVAFALERALRDAARSEGKQVRFNMIGSEVELDKKVLETLKDPLLHLVRNAVSHGIERSEERLDKGKPAEGTVHIEVRQRGSEIRIQVSDDGRGFDIAAIRKAYTNRTGNNLDDVVGDEEVMSLAFLPGLSTSKEVTAISGRGVGLDVVRQELANIQGRISIDSTAGEGTHFNLVVPTSLMMTRGLLIRVGQEHYALPLLAIEKIIEPGTSFLVGGRQMITVDDKPLALVNLAQVLRRDVPNEDQSPDPLAIILSVADQRVALLVDDVLTEQELAVKSLGMPLRRVMNVTGAALLGNGKPVVILNPADIIQSSRQVGAFDRRVNGQQVVEEAEDQIHVLVVDDSITTRTLEKNILEASGYQVTTATDGTEALDRLKDDTSIRIIVSDVEMPRMNGIVLVERVRASDQYNHLPIILVTSLESREDRERGMVAGADAYIVKRGFDQAELLSTIQYLL